MAVVEVVKEETCSQCESVLGRIILFKNRPYFDDGVMLVLVGLRRCHCCGKMFHWDGSKINVDKLTAKHTMKLSPQNGKPNPTFNSA